MNALNQKVNDAQTELDQALASNGDTFSARKKLQLAKTELEAEEQKENQKLATIESQKKSARLREADEVVKSVTDELNKTLENLTNIQTPVLHVSAYYAENVLIAHEHLSASQKKMREQKAGASKLHLRKTELKIKRQSIINKRSVGQGDDTEDSQALVLIDADLEGLAALIDKHVAAQPVIDSTAKERAVSEAQTALTLEINTGYIQALRSLVAQQEAALIATAKTLSVVPGVQVRDRYQPSSIIRAASQGGVL